MTRMFAFLVFALITSPCRGQIKKNYILVGGQFFYYHENYRFDTLPKQEITNGTIGFSIGSVFKDNRVAGINLSYSPITETDMLTGNDTVTTKYKRFNIGGFFREYRKLGEGLYFFGQVDAAVITANQTNSFKRVPGDVKATQRGAYISLTPGISYQMFKIMQVEITVPSLLSMQYLVTKFKSQNRQVKNSRREQFLVYSNLNNNLTSLAWLGVGFRFLINPASLKPGVLRKIKL